ncbi:MAG: biotin/lipoyl-binding protein, partial [Deltaproteobacteria bacterium]
MKKRMLNWAFAAIVGAALLGAGFVWRPQWLRGKPSDATAGRAAPASEEPPVEVVLSPEKFRNAGITSVSVARRQVQEERTVPGQIRYRSIRRVELKAPVDAVVEKVRVKPGDEVKQGTRLADLISPDVGLARAEVEKSESELRLANQALEWAEEITRNLNELVLFLQDKPEREEVEKEFDDKLLGTHREAIVSTYSKYIFAQQAWEKAEAALKKGAMTDSTRAASPSVR